MTIFQTNKQDSGALPPFTPITNEVAGLSHSQEWLWLSNQTVDHSAAYHTCTALLLNGVLDIGALQQSLATIVQRHNILRMAFPSVDGRPTPQIADNDAPVLAMTDLTDIPLHEREEIARQHVTDDARQPFDLNQAPLLRTRLLRLDDKRHILALVAHAMIADDQSLEQLVQELSADYSARLQGLSLDLPPALRYADVASWQHQLLQGEWGEQLNAFWAEHLHGAPLMSSLPSDTPRPAAQRLTGTTYRFELPTSLVQQVRRLGQAEANTLFTTLLAGFVTLIYRYTGQSDLVVGTSTTNRSRPELAGVIGPLADILALRYQLKGTLRLHEVVQQVQAVVQTGYAHQDMPFKLLVDMLKLPRSSSHAPLVQTLFTLRQAPLPVFDLPELTAQPYPIDTATSKHDLSLVLTEQGDTITAAIEYSTDLFKEATIARLATHYQNILTAFATNLDQTIDDLVLPSAQEQQLLAEWNSTQRTELLGHTLVELLNQQAARTPDSLAVIFEQERLTYHDLHVKVNQLAHYLQAQGVGPEVRVGVCLERSTQLVVALLGVLKAGGAYVPLDPTYPAERLAFMLEDARMAVLITQESLMTVVAPQNTTVIQIDRDWPQIAAMPSDAPPVHITPENLAYMIYTSGSTGKPKGAMNSHGAICNRLLWMQSAYELTGNDRVLQKTPFSFDVSVWEFFWPLISGACLVVARPGGQKDSAYLVDVIKREQVTTLHFVPSMLQVFLEELEVKQCSSIRQVICSGEALPLELQKRFFATFNVALYNLYGPTEAAIDVSHWTCEQESQRSFVPIGRPIANVQLSILNDQFQPQPIGVPGELFIGGVAVARGYLNRPDLTAERFCPDPFGAPGARLYRTGDLARWRDDGVIEFLGRRDYQVKLRGFRIELGEIEAVLQQHPLVREAAVVLHGDNADNEQLVAYIVLRQQAAEDSEDGQQVATTNDAKLDAVRSTLKDWLPEFMVPTAFVVLDTLPLTPSGKLDRRALPAPTRVRAATDSAFTAPRNEVEQSIAAMTAKLLGLEQISIHDNFFSWGGHSLLATRLLSWVRNTFKVELTIGDFFAGPTVANLAARVEQAVASGKQVVTIPKVQYTDHIPVTFAQERVLLVQKLEPEENLAYNFTARLRLRGDLNIAALKQSFAELIQRHESLRTTFHETAEGFVQRVHDACPVIMPIIDLVSLPPEERDEEAQRIIRQELLKPFDLTRLPLLRWLLIRMEPKDYILIHFEHHLIHDGWSFSVFLRELNDFYNGFVNNAPVTLPEMPLQFADFSYWQREWMNSEDAQQQLQFWKRKLEGMPTLLELPTDYPRPLVNRYRGRQRRSLFPPHIREGVLQLRRQEGTSLYVIMLSTFLTLLYRYSGQEDICLGAAIANRRWRESESLIGMILNNLVLRNDVSGNPTFRELLHRSQKVAGEAYAYQDLPFDKIVEALQPKRSLGHNPIFQISFNFNDGPLPDFNFAGLDVELYRILHNGSSKFDMNVTVIPRAEERVGLGPKDGDNSMELVWEYNIDLFSHATIERMFTHFFALLEQVIANPDQRLSEIPLLNEAEREQILSNWNTTQVEYPAQVCVQDVIAQQAAKSPTAVAVQYADEQLSYQAIDERANQLAHYLQKLGVKPEVRVAVALPRTPDLLVAMLGVLKAGGAYLPIDLKAPPERIAWLLADAQASIVITRQTSLPQVSEQTQVVCLDTLSDSIAAMPVTAPANLVTPDNLAYVIYTSGSTGTPKGAMITHRGLSNYLHWATQTYPIEPGRGVPVHSPIGFDLTVTGLFAPLIVGGFVDLLNDNDPVSTLRTALVRQPEYSFVKLTPAHLELLSNELNEIDLAKTTDALIVGGEALTTAQIATWRERAPGVRIFNEYGPTETVVGCCVYEVGTAEQIGGVVPIGRPIANTQLYILDQELQPAPIGVPGELYIGGVGVARGYLNRPDLTAAAFVPNPFSTEPGARLYRTGDIARYRAADGLIEYVGRRDTQVKFNGYRIELGEIEATLQAHPGVESAVVMLREDTPGNKRLVAYVVQAANNDAPQAGNLDYELRRWLSQRLPAHMVPSTYVALETLPLTANGKINRRVLPTPSTIRPDLRAAFVAPRTPIEARVATIWAETLGLEKVGIYDDFFELGGHSLLAARVMARLSDAFGVSLPLRSLFLEPTVAHLATLITATPSEQPETKAASSSPTTAIVPDSEARYLPFPLTDVQQAYWVGRVGSIELGNIATHSYREYELIDLHVERFNWAWQQLIERHDALRIIFLPDGQQQVLSSVPAYQIPVHDLRGLEPAVVQERLAALRDELSHQMLPPDRWPLFDIQVSVLDDRRAIVHYSFDALICDAWSRRILMRELTTLYNNAEAVLPSLELRFRDYVLAEEQFKHTDGYQKSLAYWRDRLATLPPAPELPLARDPSEITQPRFTRRSMTLAPEVWRQLKSRGARLRLTPSGVILAVFAEILATWSKTPHFTINLTLFNRLPLHPQINDIVGDFTSLTLLEIDYTSGSFETRAARVQQQLWNDLDHRNVSGVQVLRELSRAQGQGLRALMPVVFTSTLALHQSAEQTEAPVLLRNERYAISQTPQVWLDHHLIEQDGQLILNWDVVEELFPAGMIDAMFQGYRSLLHQLAEDETLWQGHMHDVVLTEELAEYAAINATDWPITNDLLHSGFLRHIRTQPHHPALIAGSHTLSYVELYQRASQVAQWLRTHGARPNTLVAVVMDKGWEQVVAVLGTVMAGAAYLPVDASLPTERRLYVLEHSQASLVLTQSWLDLHLEWPEAIRRFTVDQVDGQAVDVDLEGEPLQQPDDLAYVIYTSGSTGMPKGVAINHRGPVNTIYDLNDRFAIAPSDRVLALSSLSFDLSVYDIFGTLAAGATIVLPDADTTRDPGKLAALIDREQITLWNSVPALMGLLCEYLSERQLNLPESLRLVWFSGDWIPLNLPDQLRALGSDLQVISMGGATEASIWSIIYPIGTVDPAWKSIPYGRPMRNQRFYVLNEALEPCPVWVQGDLYIGGVGLAQGYWRDSEKTNASFIHHPYSGERLYRTGDLGRYLPDGNIEFLGRADFQVKIQGYRIELGEIESVLAQHPAVRNAVVLALGERHAEKRLVAYIVLQPGQSLSSSAVRQFLHEKLPAYMVPSAVVFLATLPLTNNGKVDRKALSSTPLTLEPSSVAPAPQQLGISAQVAQFIAELLKIKSLDLDTNLIEIGANSIDIIRIANQCEQRFGVRPTLRDLYTNPSVRGITALLEQQLQPTKVMVEAAASPTPELDTGLISAPSYIFEPLDPQEYAAFRAQRHNLRHDLVEQPAVQLEPAVLDAAAQEQLALRASIRRFGLQPVPSRALGELLSYLRQISINGQTKYLYASAGGLYPIQTYLFVKPGRVEGVAAGAYYYDPVQHRLVQIDGTVEFDRNVYEPTHNRPIWDEAAFGIFFFTELQAIAPLYRDKSMHFSIIEAGLMSQLLDMAAPRQQLGLCHIGGLDHERLRSLFKLGPSHAYVYSIVGGQRESGNGSTPDNGAQAEDPIARIIERVQHLSAAEAQALLAAQNAKTDQNKE